LVISLTLLGLVNGRQPITREGAKAKDAIFVTGRLGGSTLFKRHLKFNPRVKESIWLVKKFKINSMIDLSDGLSTDLNNLCRASGLGAVIYPDKIPFNFRATLEQVFHEGEDFELLFTCSESEANRIPSYTPNKVRLTYIGKMRKKQGVFLLGDNKKKIRLIPKGFSHFG
jgi:thiamine-monophosphate kinase